MRRHSIASLGLIVSFVAVCFLSTPSLSSASIVLPIVMNDQGFSVRITYYYISGPNTVVLIGSVESPESLRLTSLTGAAYINGVPVGSGSLDQPYVQLTGGVASPVSATVTTNFNIYYALSFGEITVDSANTTIPFHYESTPITVVLSGQVCVLEGSGCFPWPGFNQTSTLAML